MLARPIDISAQLARLNHSSVVELQAEWAHFIGDAAPKNARREYLIRGIAYALQARASGGLPNSLRRVLRKLADADAVSPAASIRPSRSLKSGARIYREWKGRVHEVEVTDGGFRYRGDVFKSLSVIARQITGTRWSGPAFFGLKNRSSGGQDAR